MFSECPLAKLALKEPKDLEETFLVQSENTQWQKLILLQARHTFLSNHCSPAPASMLNQALPTRVNIELTFFVSFGFLKPLVQISKPNCRYISNIH